MSTDQNQNLVEKLKTLIKEEVENQVGDSTEVQELLTEIWAVKESQQNLMKLVEQLETYYREMGVRWHSMDSDIRRNASRIKDNRSDEIKRSRKPNNPWHTNSRFGFRKSRPDWDTLPRYVVTSVTIDSKTEYLVQDRASTEWRTSATIARAHHQRDAELIAESLNNNLRR